MTKHCPTCNRELPLPIEGESRASAPSWWRDRTRPGGWMWQCADCARERLRAQAAAWYARNAERHKARCVQRRRERRARERTP